MQSLAQRFQRRPDKSDVLSEQTLNLEQRIENIKQAYHSIYKKLQLTLHTTDSDKRLKKISELSLCKCLSDSAATLSDDSLGSMLMLCHTAQTDLVNQLCAYETDIESKVLGPIVPIVERDIPAIMKLRKQLTKLHQQLEVERSKYQTAQRQTMSSGVGGQSVKVETLREEMEESENKLNLCRDQLEAEMFTFVSHEQELYKILKELVVVQSTYHLNSYNSLQHLIPEMSNKLKSSPRRPVFGCALEKHLEHTRRPISTVIESCCQVLMQTGMQEEGLFRVAGMASKVKKLKAAFDADLVDWTEYKTDPHSVAGVLKQYLRELPVPLLTYDMYNEWMQLVHCSTEDQTTYFASALKKMPRPYFENLRYLMQFLHALSKHSDANKMSPSNIAIVMAPNLLWSQNADGINFLATGALSAIIETMIIRTPQLFPEDNHFQSSSLQNKNINGEVAQHVEKQLRDELKSSAVSQVTSDGDRLNQTSDPASGTTLVSKRPNKRPPPPTPPISERYSSAQQSTAAINAELSSGAVVHTKSSESHSTNNESPSGQGNGSTQSGPDHQAETADTCKSSSATVLYDNASDSSTYDSITTQTGNHDSLPDVVKPIPTPRKAPPPPVANSKIESSKRASLGSAAPEIESGTVSQKESSHFIAKQALVSNILKKPRPVTMLTRPVQYANEDAPIYDQITTIPASPSKAELDVKYDVEFADGVSSPNQIAESKQVTAQEEVPKKPQMVVVEVDINSPVESEPKPTRPSKPTRPASRGLTATNSNEGTGKLSEDKKVDDVEQVKTKPEKTEEKVINAGQVTTTTVTTGKSNNDSVQKQINKVEEKPVKVADKITNDSSQKQTSKAGESPAKVATEKQIGSSGNTEAESSGSNGNTVVNQNSAARPVKPPPPNIARLPSVSAEVPKVEVKEEEEDDGCEDTRL